LGCRKGRVQQDGNKFLKPSLRSADSPAEFRQRPRPALRR
jgi:hypothetical protein